MLKTQIIVNTWKCDNCGSEQDALDSPFFKISIQSPGMANSISCDLDLCTDCILTIQIQSIMDYTKESL